MKQYGYPVAQWGALGEEEVDINNPKRNISNCVIGEVKDDDGTPIDYITEKIFSNIIIALTEGKNKKEFAVFTNLGQKPQVIIRYNGEFVIHNNEVPDYMEEVRNALNSLPTKVILQALIDKRIMQANRKKGDGIRVLETMLKQQTGVNYNTELIYHMCQELLDENCSDNIGIKKLFKSMTFEDVVSFVGCVREYQMTEETQNLYLAKMLNQATIDEIAVATNNEITTRFFLGRI